VAAQNVVLHPLRRFFNSKVEPDGELAGILAVRLPSTFVESHNHACDFDVLGLDFKD
jgi:hypothetical protein